MDENLKAENERLRELLLFVKGVLDDAWGYIDRAPEDHYKPIALDRTSEALDAIGDVLGGEVKTPAGELFEQKLKIKALLKRFEWRGVEGAYHTTGMCLECGQRPAQGHTKDCELAALLSVTPKK